MPNTYDVGDQVRLSVEFDVSGSPSDPTTVTFKYREQGGSTVTYVYNTDAELVKDSTGVYHVDVTLTKHGTLSYRWEGTGAVITAEQEILFARAPNPE